MTDDEAGGGPVPEPPDPDPLAQPGYPPDPTDAQPPPPGGVEGAQLLAWLLRARPFMELYEKSGVGVQPRGFRYHLCFFLDLAFRLVIATLLVAILATVAWKTLAPVPALPAWLG